MAQCLHPLYCLVKKKHMWDWESEQQATFEKAKTLVKHNKALRFSQAGLPFELGVSVIPEGMDWAL